MPIYSSEVAAQIGMYQQQHANSQAYASGLTGMMAMQGPTAVQAEKMSGTAISTMGAIGAPMLGLGLGMVGLDPMSMGMRGFSAARGMGMGMVGAGAMGLGAAAAMGGATAVAGYGINQMYQGAQQQQQFNQDMRSSFNFLTPQGRGFTTGQLGVIGNQMRGMSGQVGPMGEMTSFQELSGLAANMGKMGMANGVRDVQEFSRKFREMVTTLKTVAIEMGTSLSAAQEFVVGMKGSGVFQQADQIKASQQMRGFSASGTIAVSELSSMGNIGSQISRSVGGRGRQGFFAGMKTLGMVGAAMDAGTLNEEDIYNATGLTGAEGRQAYATSQLADSARFLRSGKGRYFLASVAGKNGGLDANSVQEWMSGDVGVGRTKGMAGSNLGKVGRANFIRNEGRLRGAAMEQFGGQLPMMALMGWAGERGIDINTMGDREMLFASRQLGMGMDSLEGLVKQVRDLPKAQEAMRRSQEADTFLRAEAGRKATQGIEGAKKKIEQTREHIQAALQQVGATLYTDLTTMIESSINKMTDTFVEQASPNLAKAVSSARRGNSVEAGRLMGLSGAGSKRGFFASAGGGGPLSASGGAQFTNRGFMGLGTSDLDRMKQAGFGSFFSGLGEGVAGGYLDSGIVNKGMGQYNEFKKGLGAGGNKLAEGIGGKHADLVREIYAGEAGQARGADRSSAVMKALLSSGKLDAETSKRLETTMASSDAATKGSFLGTLEGAAGVAEGARTSADTAPTLFSRGGGKFHTIDERDQSVGNAVLGDLRRRKVDDTMEKMNKGIVGTLSKDKGGRWSAIGSSLSVGSASSVGGGIGEAIGTYLGNRVGRLGEAGREDGGWAGAAYGAALGSGLGPVGMLVGGAAGYFGGKLAGGALGDRADKALTGTNSDTARSLGDYLHSERGMNDATTMMYGSDKEREGVLGRMQKEEMELSARIGRGEKGLDDAYASKRALRGTYAVSEAMGKGASKEELEKLARQHGFQSLGGVQKAGEAIGAAVEEQQAVNRRATAQAVGSESREKLGQFTAAGLVDEAGNINESTFKDLKLSGKAKKALMGIVSDTQKGASLGQAGALDSEERDKLEGLLGKDGSMGKNMDDLFSGSVADLRDNAQKLREKGLGGLANQLSESAGYRSRAERSLRTQGNIGLAGVLGVGPDLKTEEGRRKARSLQGIKDPKALANVLADEMGLSGVSADQARADLAAAEKNVGDEKSVGYKERRAFADKMKGRLADAEASDPLRQRLQEITAEKDPTKKAAMLEKFQKSDEMQKFQLQQEEKKKAAEDKNNPVVRAIKEQKEIFDGIKTAITALPSQFGAAVAEHMPGGGKGADGGSGKGK